MDYYLDTSVIISMIVIDSHTAKATAWFEQTGRKSLVSSLAKVEFAASVSRHVRTGHLSEAEGWTALGTLDDWIARDAHFVRVNDEDIDFADRMVRDFGSKLQAPDAIHLAAAKRLEATLATFDERLAEAAKRHAIPAVFPN